MNHRILAPLVRFDNRFDRRVSLPKLDSLQPEVSVQDVQEHQRDEEGEQGHAQKFRPTATATVGWLSSGFST